MLPIIIINRAKWRIQKCNKSIWYILYDSFKISKINLKHCTIINALCISNTHLIVQTIIIITKVMCGLQTTVEWTSKDL